MCFPEYSILVFPEAHEMDTIITPLIVRNWNWEMIHDLFSIFQPIKDQICLTLTTCLILQN